MQNQTQNCLNGNLTEQNDIPFDIKEIISEGSVKSHFQQIFSIKKTEAIGAEALARIINPQDNSPVSPFRVFQEAARLGLTLELDRLCRRRAVEGFASFALDNQNFLLFMNIETSVLNDTIVGSNMVLDLVQEYNIPPERVVIEIVESNVMDQDALIRFVSTYRERGFLIALDDMGTGHSNLNRIPILKPDIIKIDRSLIVDIDKEHYKLELFNFFIKLAHKIGVIVIAEGIEKQSEALACLELGADLVQGYYFSYPQLPDTTLVNDISGNISGISRQLKEYCIDKYSMQKAKYDYFHNIVEQIATAILNNMHGNFELTLHQSICAFPEVECVYVLDEDGIQISNTVFNSICSNRVKTALFSPSKIYTNQAAKDYYIYLDKNKKQFVTEPYVSLASGNTCVTISSLRRNLSGKDIILCVDINVAVD